MVSLADKEETWQSSRDDSANSLIFIDTNLTNYQSLIPDANKNQVVLIDSQENGIEQITNVLEQYSNLASISIFSHGDEGTIQLGDTYLSDANLDAYQSDLAAWGNALSPEGDLLLYGCNVGANNAGLDFIERVASFTSADVAASNDLTGNFNLGGDWTLEVVTGNVETQTFVLTEYGSLLAISRSDRLTGITADFNGDGKADLLRQEKGDWDDDDSETAQLLISTGNNFTPINLPESLMLKGDYTNLYVGDFNGDGKSDILRQEKSVWDNDNSWTASLLISNGTSFSNIHLSEDLYLHGDYNNIYVGDFNGDGKSDLVAQKKGSWDNNHNDSWNAKLLISNGTGFTQYAIDPGGSHSLRGDDTNLYVGDFNGDGKSDLLRQEKGGFDDDDSNTAQLLISTGTGFNIVAVSESFGLKGDYTNLYTGDFNGDGKTDVLRQEKSTWDNDSNSTAHILLSNGSGFNAYGLSESLDLKGDLTNLYVGDYNGDGKDDVLRQEKGDRDNDRYNTANLLISTGTNFNKIVLSENLNIGGDYTNLYAGDFTGDGRTDLVRQEKGWFNYDDNITAQLLVSTESNFNITSITPSSVLNGNYTNLITNNAITRYLNYKDDGLKFNFTYDNNVYWEQKKAFEFAGEMWSEMITDNVTVNIHVSMVNNSDLPDNTLGGAIPFFHQGTSYTEFKNKLSQDVDSNQSSASGNNDDQIAVNNLDAGSTFRVASPNDTNSGTWRDFDKVAMTRANAKAVGVLDSDNPMLDGTIVMNNLVGTPVSWQYDYFSNSVGSSKIDFTTVAMHEIGHTLGFVSVVDGLNTSNYKDQAILNDSVTALDLFRFLQGSQGVRSIRTGYNFLSLDGGTNNLTRTSNGVNNIGGDYYADGYQASHWKNEDNAGIMDPVLETNVRRQIGELDLRALDVIGWDRKFAANSLDTFASEAWNKADDTGNVNRNVEVAGMLSDWRWARRGSASTLRQDGNIANFLAQEGFFSIGSFRESFDFSSVNAVIKNDFIIVVDNHSLPQGFETNNDLDLENDSGVILDINLEDVVTENSGINYEEMLALVTVGLSDDELGQLSLDDLAKLIEQQLAEPVI
ncbi:NF038122 family metalloprotease [Waterburya agarophytonicola K14]|uniref:NF038122 family metalloprotease n=1 Tax=Waterburya agarophytonicola KI4 TaxID=2874699 RepID=A0A964FHN6_9CYAN|nr:NF038122 family metalloprotease [Waterburya agarophytonicola]MCC0177779.1 NF038122 family metalloprotease [Waterburya agarophytonicola KI4]